MFKAILALGTIGIALATPGPILAGIWAIGVVAEQNECIRR